jgi:GNAT superfamily N-acetyltransferase
MRSPGVNSPIRGLVGLREATVDDRGFLEDMLVEAVNWDWRRPTVPRDSVLAAPANARYVQAWKRPGDIGVVAEVLGTPVGAAWLRLFDAAAPGYGFIDERTPEVSIAVVAECRGQGIGSALLDALVDLAKRAGHPALSLSVGSANPAVALYERTGFVLVGGSDDAHTMRRDLRR